MRCEHDNHTIELPGVPPLPVKPPRTTQAQRMAQLGYEGPKERPSCHNCMHCGVNYLNADSLAEVEVLRCGIGDFPVLRGGQCREWTAS